MRHLGRQKMPGSDSAATNCKEYTEKKTEGGKPKETQHEMDRKKVRVGGRK